MAIRGERSPLRLPEVWAARQRRPAAVAVSRCARCIFAAHPAPGPILCWRDLTQHNGRRDKSTLAPLTLAEDIAVKGSFAATRLANQKVCQNTKTMHQGASFNSERMESSEQTQQPRQTNFVLPGIAHEGTGMGVFQSSCVGTRTSFELSAMSHVISWPV